MSISHKSVSVGKRVIESSSFDIQYNTAESNIMQVDKRELRIVLQNAMAHATKIAMHNAKDKKVDTDTVLKLAGELATKVYRLEPIIGKQSDSTTKE